MKIFTFLLCAIIFASCGSAINMYCRTNKNFPGQTKFYRDFSIFGLQGIDEISCESARQESKYFFMSWYKDSLDYVIVKPFQQSKRRFFIQRRRSSVVPLYQTTLLEYSDPGGGWDTILVSNSSQFILQRTIKFRLQTEPSLNLYYIWDKKSANRIEFYYYSMTAGNYLNPANYGSNGRLLYKIEFTISNGVLYKKTINQGGQIAESNEKFDSEFDQILLQTLFEIK